MQSLILVEMTRLGDVICTFPALRRIRSAFPEASIAMAVQKEYAELIESSSLDIHAIGLHSSRTIVGLLASMIEVRRTRYDLACALSPARRNAYLVLGSRAGIRAGYLRPTRSRIQYLRESPVTVRGQEPAVSVSYGKEHIATRALKVCDALGLPDVAPVSIPALKSASLEASLTRVSGFLSAVRSPFVAIHPFAAWEFKEWPVGNYVALVGALSAGSGLDVVVICEEADRDRWNAACTGKATQNRVHVFSSARLMDVAAVISQASVLVGNDSGPLHLASLLGTPVVGLFGPATPELTAPRGFDGACLYHAKDCSPCAQTSCVDPKHHCMSSISVDDVLATVQSLCHIPTQRFVSAHA
jgi:ADP-heptose:LPS heptosyltransferase